MKSFTTVFLLLVGLIATPSSTEDVDDDMETACFEKTGSSQAYEILLASGLELRTCIRTNFDLMAFMNDWRDLNAFTRHRFFSERCPEMRRALACFDPPVEALSKCLDDDIIHFRFNSALKETLDLLCDNGGEILYYFRNNDCVRDYSFTRQGCNALTSISTKGMAFSKYGEAQCGELAKSRDCMERDLKECNVPKVMNVLDVYWRAILKNSPCENLPDETLEIEAAQSNFPKSWPTVILKDNRYPQ